MQGSNTPAIAPAAPVAGTSSPTAVWRAYDAQRDELRTQLSKLEDRRGELSEQLKGDVSGASRAGLEQRIVEIDKRISDVEKQVADADASVAKAAAVPGAVVAALPPAYHDNGPPEGVVALGAMFMLVVLMPISIAMARRMWKRGKDAIVALPQDLTDRLNRLDHSIDAIAVEVERIGEGQRFVTRVMTDSGRGVGAGAGQPAEVPVRNANAPR